MACTLSYSLAGITGDCSNVNGGSFSINIFGTAPDYSIQWTSPYTNIVSLGPGVTGFTQTSLSAGTYTFNVIDSCSPVNTSLPVSIYISSGTCISVNSVTNTLCNSNNGSISATTQYDYGNTTYSLYHNSLGLIATSEGTSGGSVVFENISPGPYYILADDGGGCTGRTSMVIVQDSSQLDYGFYVVNDAGCNVNSGKIFVTGLTGTPPYTYVWSNGKTDSSITGLTAGSYDVTVSDGSGCSVTKNTNVEKVLPIGQAGVYVTQPSCFGSNGEVTIVLSGGTPPFYYSGSNGVIKVEFANYVTFDNLPAGGFTYYVQDAGLCNFNGSVSLITPSSFNIVSVNTTNTSCGNTSGSLNVVVTNGTPPYIFKLNGSSVSTTLGSYTFSNLSPGSYTLTIKDNSNCTYTETYVIEDDTVFDFDFDVTGTTCGYDNGIVKITITDGVGPYLYQVGTVTQSLTSTAATFNNLVSGSYPISVTDLTLSCTLNSTVLIEDSDNVDFIPNSVNPLGGNNGIIRVYITDGEPPFNVEWSSNVNGQTGMRVDNLSAGTYTVNVVDNNGCAMEKTVVLEGSFCSVAYEVYSICQKEFSSQGTLVEKTPLLMLNEGYADLVMDEGNCVLNSANFEAIVNVGGVSETSIFYTSTSLTDAPSETLFGNTVRSLLLTFEGIGNVTINNTTNKITITTDCESEVSLSDVEISVNMKIYYDISCACSKTCLNYPYICSVDFLDDENATPTAYDIITFGNNCKCDYTSLESVQQSYRNADNAIDKLNDVRQNRNEFIIQMIEYTNEITRGFCPGDGVSIPDTSLITYDTIDSFMYKGTPKKIRGYRNIKANQTEAWYYNNIGATLSAYTDDVRYLKSIPIGGSLPVSGLPGDLILSGNVNNNVGYAWDPSINAWSSGFYSVINDNVVGEFRIYQNSALKQKNELLLAMKPFTWSNFHMMLHNIKLFALAENQAVIGSDVIMNNGEDLPCGYSRDLNDCGTLQPYCDTNRHVDNIINCPDVPPPLNLSCVNSVVPPTTIGSVNVTETSTGSVSTYSSPYTSCVGLCPVTTPRYSKWLGSGGAFTYTLNFSVPINNITIFITAAGHNVNENFIITTNTGTGIPTISSDCNCFTTIIGNEILTGEGSSFEMGGSGGKFLITNSEPFTTLTITGDGGDNGSLLSICSNSI